METLETTSEKLAINRAIELQGGITAFAKALGLNSHTVIQQWRINRVPAERCPAIEKATGGLVRCEDLRPDVQWHVLRNTQELPPPPTTPAQAATETVAGGV